MMHEKLKVVMFSICHIQTTELAKCQNLRLLTECEAIRVLKFVLRDISVLTS